MTTQSNHSGGVQPSEIKSVPRWNPTKKTPEGLDCGTSNCESLTDTSLTNSIQELHEL